MKEMKYSQKVKPKTFSLKIWMKNYGVSGRGLAKLTGVDYAHVHRLSNGMYVATPETAVKMFKKMMAYENKINAPIRTNFTDIISDILSPKI